jgi:hypothetical protein
LKSLRVFRAKKAESVHIPVITNTGRGTTGMPTPKRSVLPGDSSAPPTRADANDEISPAPLKPDEAQPESDLDYLA